MSTSYEPEATLEAIVSTVLDAAGLTVLTSRSEDTQETPCVLVTATSNGTAGSASIVSDVRRFFAWELALSVTLVVNRSTAATDMPTMLAAVRSNLITSALKAAAIADATVAHNVADIRETGSERAIVDEHNVDTYTLNFTALVGAKLSAIAAL
jgi:hypothetical protein